MANTATTPGYHGNARHHDDDRTLVDEPVQRRIYGGFHFGSSFFGWLITIGVSAIVTTILSGITGAVVANTAQIVTPENITSNIASFGLTGGLLLLITMAVAYFTGGYVAGRMNRFDGMRQGFGVWVVGLVIGIALSIIGAILAAANADQWNQLLQQMNVPTLTIDTNTLTLGGVVFFVVMLIVTLAAAVFGGKVGESYHRKVDSAGMVETETTTAGTYREVEKGTPRSRSGHAQR